MKRKVQHKQIIFQPLKNEKDKFQMNPDVKSGLKSAVI
jgi:hypothetical protein